MGIPQFNINRMKAIKVLSDAATTTSKFIKLRNVKFIQNNMTRSWDYISVDDFVYHMM